MTDINKLIIEKLSAYPDDVRLVAEKALEFATAEHTSESLIAEQLKGLVRDVVKQEPE